MKAKDIEISKIVEGLPPSGIRVFFDLVIGMKDVLSLGIGEPDFVTPWNIRERAISSLEEGFTSYTSNKGLLELRKDISRHLKHRYKLEYDPEEEILITVGTSEGFDVAMRALINPGDRILMTEPSYVSYDPIAQMCGGVPVHLKTDAANGFKITAKDINDACSEKTKALILSYPNNPTGASYPKEELRKLSGAILKNDLVMISDEIYGELTYDFEHTPFATLPHMKERTIYINGFSKAYAMTGWRVGYVCGPKKLVGAMTKIHQYTMLCASIMSQVAAREALKAGERSLNEMKREYKRRREFVISRLNEIGLLCHHPEGAFYAFPSVRSTGLSSMDFANKLLKNEKVAVVPGTAFGPSGEGYIRISYASSIEKLREALARIEKFIKEVRKQSTSQQSELF